MKYQTKYKMFLLTFIILSVALIGGILLQGLTGNSFPVLFGLLIPAIVSLPITYGLIKNRNERDLLPGVKVEK